MEYDVTEPKERESGRMKLFSNRIFIMGLYLIIGGIAGFAFYYFIGCNSGSCAITSNPYISTTYGMIMGLLLSIDSKKKKKDNHA